MGDRASSRVEDAERRAKVHFPQAGGTSRCSARSSLSEEAGFCAALGPLDEERSQRPDFDRVNGASSVAARVFEPTGRAAVARRTLSGAARPLGAHLAPVDV